MLSKITALLGVALCAAAGEYASAQSPLFLWSNRATFAGNGAYVGSVWSEKDVASAINSVLAHDTTQSVNSVLSSTTVPHAEALCLFVRENLRSSELADFGEKSFVQSAVKDSTSSVVITHTTRSQSLTPVLESSSPVPVSLDDIEKWIQSTDGKKVLGDGLTDLVVITVPQTYTLPVADAKIEEATKALIKATNGLVDFALTANSATEKRRLAGRRLATGTTSVSATDIICDAGYLVGMSSTGKAFCFSHYVRMTPEVLTALLFGFFFLFLAYVGLSVLHAIQTPLRYPLHGPPKGKEF